MSFSLASTVNKYVPSFVWCDGQFFSLEFGNFVQWALSSFLLRKNFEPTEHFFALKKWSPYELCKFLESPTSPSELWCFWAQLIFVWFRIVFCWTSEKSHWKSTENPVGVSPFVAFRISYFFVTNFAAVT